MQFVFINLSNHPSKDWPVTQLLAARELGGEVADVPFPEVAPEADPLRIQNLARNLVMQISQLNAKAAMVHGEPVLVYQVVHLLEKAGIRCFAATTKRIVKEETGGGVTKKTSQFEFVQFRPYQ